MHPKVSYRFVFVIGVIGLILLEGCDRKQGCLDPNATNYMLDAEVNCCCEYPDLILEASYLWNQENINLGDTLLNDNGVPIITENFAIYLSQFQLTDINNSMIIVDNEIDIGNASLTDDIILLKRAKFSYVIGSFNHRETLINVAFSIGLPAELDNVAMAELDIGENHPLAIQADSLYRGDLAGYDELLWSGYVDGKFTEIRTQVDMPMSYDETATPVLGSDLIIPIEIHFDRWFNGIDVNTLSDEIESIILGNLDGSIEISN